MPCLAFAQQQSIQHHASCGRRGIAEMSVKEDDGKRRAAEPEQGPRQGFPGAQRLAPVLHRPILRCLMLFPDFACALHPQGSDKIPRSCFTPVATIAPDLPAHRCTGRLGVQNWRSGSTSDFGCTTASPASLPNAELQNPKLGRIDATRYGRHRGHVAAQVAEIGAPARSADSPAGESEVSVVVCAGTAMGVRCAAVARSPVLPDGVSVCQARATLSKPVQPIGPCETALPAVFSCLGSTLRFAVVGALACVIAQVRMLEATGSISMAQAMALAQLIFQDIDGPNKAVRLFTDGLPNDPTLTLLQAEVLHREGTVIAAVGTADAEPARASTWTECAPREAISSGPQACAGAVGCDGPRFPGPGPFSPF